MIDFFNQQGNVVGTLDEETLRGSTETINRMVAVRRDAGMDDDAIRAELSDWSNGYIRSAKR
jgi:hypothetical protein